MVGFLGRLEVVVAVLVPVTSLKLLVFVTACAFILPAGPGKGENRVTKVKATRVIRVTIFLFIYNKLIIKIKRNIIIS